MSSLEGTTSLTLLSDKWGYLAIDSSLSQFSSSRSKSLGLEIVNMKNLDMGAGNTLGKYMIQPHRWLMCGCGTHITNI